MNSAVQHALDRLANASLDDIQKLVLAGVALIALFLGPWMQWRIAKRQMKLQGELSANQLKMQDEVMKRQAADNISAKRQVWIDELRRDTAAWMSHLMDLMVIRMKMLPEQTQELWLESAAIVTRAHQLELVIRLRMNPHEASHVEFLALVKALSDTMINEIGLQDQAKMMLVVSQYHMHRDVIVSKLQGILKQEWTRIKAGTV